MFNTAKVRRWRSESWQTNPIRLDLKQFGKGLSLELTVRRWKGLRLGSKSEELTEESVGRRHNEDPTSNKRIQH